MQPFHGEIFIEDPTLGKQSLYAAVGENGFGEVEIRLHNANPPDSFNLIGQYGNAWLLRKIKRGFLVTVYELTFLHEIPPVKVRCVTGHKFGKMLEAAIEKLKLENQ